MNAWKDAFETYWVWIGRRDIAGAIPLEVSGCGALQEPPATSRRLYCLPSTQALLPDIEYQLQAELTANADLILTYEQLLRRVWGHDSSGAAGPVRAIVRRLRLRLGAAADPTYIFNKRRIGYWMEKGETREQ